MKSVCGDGIKAVDEECDDGNLKNQDGCNKNCLKDCGWKCPFEGRACVWETCGNGKIGRFEQCDGGPLCNYDCTLI